MKLSLLAVCALLVGWSINETVSGDEPNLAKKPLPADFPEFSHIRERPINGPAGESDFRGLQYANIYLLGELDKYTRDSIAEAFESRMSRENEIHVKILFAEIAAENGSRAAAQFLQELAGMTDVDIAKSRLDALSDLLRKSPADWVFEAIYAALRDTRKVRESGRLDGQREMSSLAADEADLYMALGEARNPKSVPVLIEAVQHSPHNDRAIAALGTIGDPRGIPVLLELLQSQDKAIQEKKSTDSAPSEVLVSVLATSKVHEIVPILLRYLHAGYFIDALGQLGDQRAILPLKSIIEDPSQLPVDPSTKKVDARKLFSIRMALIRLEKDDPIPKWIAILGDPAVNDFSKIYAVDELRDKPDPRAIDPLLSVIKSNSDLMVVKSSMVALSYIKYRKTVEGLIGCFDVNFAAKHNSKDPSQTCVEYLGLVLHELTGQDFGADKVRWAKWWGDEGKNVEGLK